jgi:hypothetical protein
VDTTFRGNQAKLGAGLSLGATGAVGPIVIMNTEILDNHAAVAGGGIRVTMNGTVAFTLASSVVAGNSAGTHSGGIFNNAQYETEMSGQPTSIVNSIIWGNSAPEDPQLRAERRSLPQPILALDHVNLQGGCPDTGAHVVSCSDVLDVEPLFVDLAGGDLHLEADSTLIDAGDQALLPEDLLDIDGDLSTAGDPWPFDLDGAARVTGLEVDLGPYERP